MLTSLVVDALLVAGFGVQHSVLATVRVKTAAKARTSITPLAWRSIESLSNVTYILIAAALWQGTNYVVWDIEGFAGYLVLGVAIVSWLWYWQLHLFEYDCGLAFGSTTLVAQITGKPQFRLISWRVGSRNWIRFPVHTAFFGMFFALPYMTADLLVLAVTLNLYNVIGSILYDMRLKKAVGAPYEEYVSRTGLIFPPVYRAPYGARNLEMPSPMHWRRPVVHVGGLVVGVVVGVGYYLTLGSLALTAFDMIKTALVGLAASLVVGLVIGKVSRPDPTVTWNQQQTDLSTTVALAAATGVAIYAGVTFILDGNFPVFAVYLPLWFIVQYLGHVVAVWSSRDKWVPAAPTNFDVEARKPVASHLVK